MDHLYSLYNALASINVPTDKARAVVDAIERDMATTIATKSDLQLLRQELTSLISGLATRDELRSLELALRADLTDLRSDQALMRKDIEVLAMSFRKDLEMLSTTMTVRLGSLIAVGLGVLFAALKLT